MFENIEWDQIFMVLGAGALTISVALKIMYDARKDVEELERQNALEN